MPDLAEIFRLHAAAYRQTCGVRLLPSQERVLRDLSLCRTAHFGGHLLQCPHCSQTHYRYHSCQNRHCPQCQQPHTQRWLQRQQDRLLPGDYYLITATLPAELRALARVRQKKVYGLLLQAAGGAILALTKDPRYLGATPGLLGVIHTWTRALLYHPHVHFLVSAAGVDTDGSWIGPKHPHFLVPVRALSRLVRAKFRAALRRQGDAFETIPPGVWTKEWVVHCQPAGSGKKVLPYLARYLHRVAISNHRIESLHDGRVTFRYRDNRTQQIRHVTLPAEEFIGRFLQHVLPRRFCKVRAYGLWSPRYRRILQQLRARATLPAAATEEPPSPNATPSTAETLRGRCPFCHQGPLLVIRTLARKRGPP